MARSPISPNLGNPGISCEVEIVIENRSPTEPTYAFLLGWERGEMSAPQGRDGNGTSETEPFEHSECDQVNILVIDFQDSPMSFSARLRSNVRKCAKKRPVSSQPSNCVETQLIVSVGSDCS